MERFRFFFSLGLVATVGLAAVIACDPPAAKKTLKTTPDKDKGDDDDTGKDDDDDNVPVTPVDVKPESDPPLPDGGKPPGRVFAHTATALYLFDPLAKTLKKIGDFKGLEDGDSVIDLAVDRDSVVFGTTFRGFIKIDAINADIVYVKKEFQTYPNALAFMPLGTVDMTKEALVGYGPPVIGKASDYLRINIDTGEMTKIGELNDPASAVKYVTAGDIISMERNGKAYVAIKKAPVEVDANAPPPPVESDSIAEIDPKTGRIKTILGNIGSDETYGLAQWAGVAYAFNAKGNIIEVDLLTGKGKTILNLIENNDAGAWYGAGVTTDSPTKP